MVLVLVLVLDSRNPYFLFLFSLFLPRFLSTFSSSVSLVNWGQECQRRSGAAADEPVGEISKGGRVDVMEKRTAVLSSPAPFEMRRAGERCSIEAVVVDIWPGSGKTRGAANTQDQDGEKVEQQQGRVAVYGKEERRREGDERNEDVGKKKRSRQSARERVRERILE